MNKINKLIDNIKEILLRCIITVIIIICFAIIIYGIFFYPSIREKDMRDNYYISTYEVHYLDGVIDTAQVIGPYSNEREVYYSTATLTQSEKGYVFCGIYGICRVNLLSYKKISPKFDPIYYTDIKFKNNK